MNKNTEGKDKNEAAAPSLWSASTSWIQNLLETVNCVVNVPMWTMAGANLAFGIVCYYAPRGLRNTLLFGYLPYCILDSTPRRGLQWISETTRERLRHFPPYKLLARYFPITLHKTQDLSSDKSYIFLYHPHGIIGMGATTALVTNACDFDAVFPGIRRVGVTLNVAFYIPFFREWILMLGFVSANKSTLKAQVESGRSIVLVPGGAAEALHCHPQKFQLIVRQGFLRLAQETGATLVPCLGFGENRAFSTLHTEGLLRRIQQRLYKLLTFSMPILTSPIPVRVPIDVVVGPPLPNVESQEELAGLYKQAVEHLYMQHCHRFGHGQIPLEWIVREQ